MKHLRSLFVSLSALLVAAASGCSTDLCDIDADCLNYPDAICYDGHCANLCYTQRDCDTYVNATSRSNEFCADTARGFVCLPVYDIPNFCRYDEDCDMANWEYCDRSTSTCVIPVQYSRLSSYYESCNTSRDCIDDAGCYGGICLPRCYRDNNRCRLGDYCSPSYDVCVPDPNRRYDDYDISWGAGASCRDDVDCKDGTTRCLYNMCYAMCHHHSDCNLYSNMHGVCDPYESVCMYY